MDLNFLERMLHEIIPERIQSHLENLAQITKVTTSGITRLGYTQKENEAIEYVRNTAREYGLNTRLDPVGNLYFGVNGASGRKRILMGSHIDSVVCGGKYDGAAGVIIALESLKCLQGYESRFKYGFEGVAFRCEESTRFGRALLGSSMATGKLSHAHLKDIRAKGVTLADAIEDCGYCPEKVSEAKLNPSDFVGFFEPHIEQGPYLESIGCSVGIPTIIAGPIRYKITIEGRPDHSGAAPMNMRKDALVAAADIIRVVKELGDYAFNQGKKTVATVTNVEIENPSPNRIPGKVTLSVDVRDIFLSDRDLYTTCMEEEIRKIESRKDVKTAIVDIDEKKPMPIPDEMQKLLIDACKTVGVKYERVHCGASHDAANLAGIGIPIGLILLRSQHGSHCPQEHAELCDLVDGTKVLLSASYLRNSY